MQLDWYKEYSGLTDFIAQHPEITVGKHVVRIPSKYSSTFYFLHKKARASFLKEKTPHLLEKAQELSKNYLRVEEEVINLIGLQGISMQPSLDNFLHNPTDQLTKEVYNPFYSLLKGQLDIGKFEEIAIHNVESLFKILYRSGYEKWVILSLVKLLKADKVYKVIPEEVTEDDSFRHGGILDYKIPDPQESSDISFKRATEVGFMVPDLLIHSTVTDDYHSFTSEIIKAYASANNPSKKRGWLAGDPAVIFESGIILVYNDKHLENLSLVADMQRTCRADLIIECRENIDWYEKEGFSNIKLHYDKYQPRLGTYIVTITPVSEQWQAKLISEKVSSKTATVKSPHAAGKKEVEYPSIHLFTVGFNQTKLEPIIDALSCK